ncbi:MAG: riboflavin synthase [Candidatus Eremiobacteraeota bacterium]|nr:riboflavin synthase [Candidatus Eremiobacteraeota bacterium]
MFTGLVEEVAQIASLTVRGQQARLTVATEVVHQDARIGDSIAVNGICLTVVAIEGQRLSFDAVAETVRRTSLAGLGQGSRVNLERAVAVGGRMGGHYVQGHVDGTGRLVSIQPEGNGNVFRFAAESALLRYIVPKGSIAVDGISLTVVDVDDASFSVWIVPHTMSHTNLGQLRAGATVNLETDVLAKYTEKLLLTARGNLSEDKLKTAGFIDQ